jgi:hypothetical protein
MCYYSGWEGTAMIDPEETDLIGKTIVVGGQVQANDAWERIEKLTSDYLQEVATDESGWETLYRDPQDGRYWERTYPQGEYHGGGPPRLTYISEEQARAKYGGRTGKKTSLQPDEVDLIGRWIFDGEKVIGDDTEQRIELLTSQYLEKLASDPSGWYTLYRDPQDGRYWELTYPQSHMQGGGPPRLTQLLEEDARAKFGRDIVKSSDQSDPYLEHLEALRYLLAKYQRGGQAIFVSNLIDMRRASDPDFLKYLASVEMWGGSGSVWEVDKFRSSNREGAYADELRFRNAIISIANQMEKDGVGSERTRYIAETFKVWTVKGL